MNRLAMTLLALIVASPIMAAYYPYNVTLTASPTQIQSGANTTLTAQISPAPTSDVRYTYTMQLVVPCVEAETTFADNQLYPQLPWFFHKAGEYQVSIRLTVPTIQRGVRKLVGLASTRVRVLPTPNPGVGNFTWYPPSNSVIPASATIRLSVPATQPTTQRFTFWAVRTMGNVSCTPNRKEVNTTGSFYDDFAFSCTGTGQVRVEAVVDKIYPAPQCQFVGTGTGYAFFNVQ
jgi:hypothetical protein